MLAIALSMLTVSTSGAALTVHLSLVEGQTVELRLGNAGPERIVWDVSAAFMLMPVDSSEDAVPNRTLWGPADPTMGRPYDRATRVGPRGVEPPRDPQPRLILESGQTRTTRINLDELKWQLHHLSVGRTFRWRRPPSLATTTFGWNSTRPESRPLEQGPDRRTGTA